MNISTLKKKKLFKKSGIKTWEERKRSIKIPFRWKGKGGGVGESRIKLL